MPSIPQLDGVDDDESLVCDGKFNHTGIAITYYNKPYFIAEYDHLFDEIEASLRRFDEEAASFEAESALFRQELEYFDGWLWGDAPTPSPLHRPTSPWRVDEGATTSSRTSECLWE